MQYLGACSIWVCDQRFFLGINILVFYYNWLLNVIITWTSVGFVCVAGTKTTINSGSCWLQCRKCKNTKREYMYIYL